MARLSGSKFLKNQLSKKIPQVTRKDLSGKTVCLIGANAGLGFEAAKHLASMNPAKLILGCRRKEAGEAAVKELEKKGYNGAVLEIIDLASFASVKTFAEKVAAANDRLDILILNAGVLPADNAVYTSDGWETTLQVNNVASSYLAILLSPLMIKTAREHPTESTPRLVIVASEVHYWAKFDQEVIKSPNILERLSNKEYRAIKKNMGRQRYFQSKALNVFFARAIQRHLPTTDPTITVVSVTPNYCASSLRREISKIELFLDRNIGERFFAYTTEEGSRQIVYASVAGLDNKEEDAKLRGTFLYYMAPFEPADFVIDETGRKAEENVWKELTQEILPKIDSNIPTILNELFV